MKKTYIVTTIVVIAGLLLLALAMNAQASKFNHDVTFNPEITVNHYDEPDADNDADNNVDSDCLCVSRGLSNSDLSRSLSLAMTAGAHEMDYSTQDWQLSVTYAQQVNEDEEGAYSAKIGKRWDKLGKALLHVTYVPEQGQDYGDWVVVGGTIRF